MYIGTSRASGVLLALSTVFLASCFHPRSLHVLADEETLTRRTTVASGVELRMLPLGDSITYGTDSSDGNGYRIGLQENLDGSDQLFIGSVQSGNMYDNDNEGHPGATINQIASFAWNSLPDRPNVVLLHAGTNDLNNPNPTDPYSGAPDRLGSLIDEIVGECPDAAVLVAQIIQSANSDTEARIQDYNSQIPGVVADRANQGQHVMVVDMSSIGGSDLSSDGTHPTDAGYQIMAGIWLNGLQTADSYGWIQPPVGSDPPTRKPRRERRALSHPMR
ncbi:SGNH hydrolase-type esterase domain [Lasallia pustulata]|uniref:SGNH hydrolase-type esterase domain n=1 Tax=Lasallia pustulata TaxID=136370 RepID=A0A1W5D4R9_9LECA|nr:SGNH hydrolase-type esterase domain [Lasallia pustulata]